MYSLIYVYVNYTRLLLFGYYILLVVLCGLSAN